MNQTVKLERFCQSWVSMLWEKMFKTGHGYRRHSMRRTATDKDRRKDKLTRPKVLRRLSAFRC